MAACVMMAALLFVSAGPKPTAGNPKAEINHVLDDWHDAAGRADEKRYFGYFTASAVFLGTDAHERWTTQQFRKFAHPYFARGKAWNFKPKDRHITLASDGRVAWFDERLDTPNLGPARGSGVLVLQGHAWKISQYNLSVPIPNELMAKVKQIIEAAQKQDKR
ncbi:MAG TPA: nuclear transport factor 2 family protein [Gemmataceae bacterium]|nr:nuclear transport factor 2 family protein [Gemmataceae bacterium]